MFIAIAFTLFVPTAFASSHEVQKSQLIEVDGCYGVDGKSINAIESGDRIRCYSYYEPQKGDFCISGYSDKYRCVWDTNSYELAKCKNDVWIKGLGSTEKKGSCREKCSELGSGCVEPYVDFYLDGMQLHVIVPPFIINHKITTTKDSMVSEKSDTLYEMTKNFAVTAVYNRFELDGISFNEQAIDVAFFLKESVRVTEPSAIKSAEKSSNSASALSKAIITDSKVQAEKAFGPGTVLRWDAYVNPNQKIRCNDGSIELVQPPPEKVKTVLASIYYASERASSNKYGVKISPLLVYTIGMGEGLINRLNLFYCGYDAFSEIVSGFKTLGLDHFASEAETLKQGGFLRNDFNKGDEYYLQVYLNEKHENVNSAIFKNLHYGLEALAARVAYSKYLFERDVKTLGIDINEFSEDEINYWTYYYFNTGAGSAKSFLASRISAGTLHEKSTINAKPGEKVRNGSCGRHNAIIRTATASFINDLGIFA